MDADLAADARALRARTDIRHPLLWLLTDARRLPDPRPAIAALPRGAGVVFRHDNAANRAALAAEVAALCRARGLALTVAGDARLALRLGAGQHLRGWERPHPACRGPITVSTHGVAELRRAARIAGAVAFLSPVFATLSHPGARVLGPARFAAMARRAGVPVLALGGIDAGSIKRLRFAAGVGAIGALAAPGAAGARALRPRSAR